MSEVTTEFFEELACLCVATLVGVRADVNDRRNSLWTALCQRWRRRWRWRLRPSAMDASIAACMHATPRRGVVSKLLSPTTYVFLFQVGGRFVGMSFIFQTFSERRGPVDWFDNLSGRVLCHDHAIPMGQQHGVLGLDPLLPWHFLPYALDKVKPLLPIVG